MRKRYNPTITIFMRSTAMAADLSSSTSAPGSRWYWSPIILPDDDIVFFHPHVSQSIVCAIFTSWAKPLPYGCGTVPIFIRSARSTLFWGDTVAMIAGWPDIIWPLGNMLDRNFGDAQGLWTVNPDGTNHAGLLGEITQTRPGGVIDAPFIFPESKRWFIAIPGQLSRSPMGEH